MKNNLYVFSMKYKFVASNYKEAIEKFREMLADEDWGRANQDPDNWDVDIKYGFSDELVLPKP
jgi:hypothetical protein